MSGTRHAAYAAVAWSLPVVMWMAGALWSEAPQPGGAARAALRVAPLLPALQILAVAVLLPALAWRSGWRHTAAVAAIIVLAPWPAAALLVQTAGVTWFGLGVGQFVVALWAAVAALGTRLAAMADTAPDLRLPIAQAVLVVAGLALARTMAPVFNGMVAL